jgi:Leucine-rich repeat (LRR) protein
LQNNQLVEFEVSNNIRDLNLGNNRIKRLFSKKGSALWRLNLFNNNIENLQGFELIHLENLTELDLSKNPIKFLNTSTFLKLSKLQILGLKETNITSIQFGTFTHLPSMEFLSITGFSMDQIDLHLFIGLEKLRKLEIGGDKLGNIENLEAISTVLPSLGNISLTDSNFDCSYLKQILTLATQSHILVYNPTAYHGTNVKGIKCFEKIVTASIPISDIILDCLVCVAALMIIICAIVKLFDRIKHQKLQAIEQHSLRTVENDLLVEI